MVAVRFPKMEVVLTQLYLRYVIDIWHTDKQIPALNLNSEVDFRLHGRHVEKQIWGNNSAADYYYYTRMLFCISFAKLCSNVTTLLRYYVNVTTLLHSLAKLMQNDMPMTIHTSKSKPEIWLPCVFQNRK